MCGIYGYIGAKTSDDAVGVVLEGLGKLSYRGYDSWGVAGLDDSKIKVVKNIGVVPEKKPSTLGEYSVAIGHTRWATHGGVTRENAHPHSSRDGSFVLAQNGIVENFAELKSNLEKKHEFISTTDTEVIVRLIEENRKKSNSLQQAVRKAFAKLQGRNTIILLSKNAQVIAARNGSPACTRHQ
jgi:glucosamine--fructose-6-phosphate aminotransferase (isomerizing)